MRKRFLVMITALIMLLSCVALVGCNKNTVPSDTTPSIELPSDTLELYTGQTALITPVVKNTSAMLMWQSSKSEVADVDQSGLVTAYRAGTAVITVFNSDTSSEMTVTVVDPEAAASISFDVRQLGVTLYDYIVLTPRVIKLDGDITWRSTDESVLTVDGGVITQRSLGTADVTASIGGLSAKVTVTVSETDKVPTLEFDRESVNILTGGKLSVVPTVKFDGKPVSGFDTKFVSLDPDIATVDGNGLVTGVKVGETDVTADVTYRGYAFATEIIRVTVKVDADVILSQNNVELYTREFGSLGYRKATEVTVQVTEGSTPKPNASVVWSSGDSNIATVANGVITAVSEGKTVISATYSTTDGETVSTNVNVDVKLPVITVNDRAVRDLSESGETVQFTVPDAFDDLTLDAVTVNGKTLSATQSDLNINVANNADMKAICGEVDVVARFTDVVYKFPSLIITESISDMDDLRDVAAKAQGKEVFDGYFVLNNDITANNDDDFILFNVVWSNDANKGFVGTFDGQGHGIYNIKVGTSGLFRCVGGKGIIRDLALVDVTGSDFALATEFRGTADNIFVKSATKSTLLQMSDEAAVRNGFAILPSSGSSVVSTIYSSTCTIENFYALADKIIGYTSFSQGSEPTIAAKPSVAEIKAELSALDFETSGYDKSLWELKDGTPIYKTYMSHVGELRIVNPAEVICSQGQTIEIKTSDFAQISLKTAVDGITVNGMTVTVDKTANATVVATDLYGDSAEKSIAFIVAAFSDKTDVHLFDYELGGGDLSFDLPSDMTAVDKISFGDGAYYAAADGISVASGKVTVTANLVNGAVNKYADGVVTLVSGSDYVNYSCSFVTKKIMTYDDLKDIAVNTADLDGYFILGADIVANNETPMTRLCAYTDNPKSGFKGIFDGRGHTVTNLKLAMALFGSVADVGVVKNFALVNVSTEHAQNAILVGEVHGGTFENIFVSTPNKGLFLKVYHTVTLKNTVFVSTAPGKGIFEEGSGTAGHTFTKENMIIIGTNTAPGDSYGHAWYGNGLKIETDVSVYASIADMFAALEAENKLAAWAGSYITYDDGVIKYNGAEVLNGFDYHAHDWAQTADSKYLMSEATCDTAAVYCEHCTICDENGTATFTSGSALGHNSTHHEQHTASSCDQESNYEYWYCERCEKYSRTEDFAQKLDRDGIFYTSDHSFDGITVTGPEKTVYALGDTLDQTGLAVKAHCSKCGNDIAVSSGYTVEQKALVKGPNEFTVTYDIHTASFTVYAYENKDITNKGSVADFVYNASATRYSAKLEEVSDTVTKVEIGGIVYDSDITHTSGTLAVPAGVINALSDGKTYGDYEIVLYTDAFDIVKVKIAVVTKIINEFNDLKSVWSIGTPTPTAANALDGYYILGRDIVSSETLPRLYAYVASPNGDYGFKGIFDGRGHMIKNVNFTNSMFYYVAKTGIVRNIAFIDVTTSVDYLLTESLCGGTFENIFISTAVKRAFGYMFPYGDVRISDFVFVTSAVASDTVGLYDTGNTVHGKYTIDNAVVISNQDKGYRSNDANNVETDYHVYSSADTMWAAFADDNKLAAWNGLISYESGKLLFNGVTVLRYTERLEAENGLGWTDTAVYSETGTFDFTLPNTVTGDLLSLTANGADVEGATIDGGKLKLPRSVLGDKKYGDILVVFETESGLYSAKVAVVTEKIGTYADIKRIWNNNTSRTSGSLDGYYVLTQDITLNGSDDVLHRMFGYNGSADGSYGFKGIFDGRGHVIKNLRVDYSIFGALTQDAVIRNVAFVNITSVQTAAGTLHRCIADEIRGGTFENMFIQSPNMNALFNAIPSGNIVIRNTVLITDSAWRGLFGSTGSAGMNLTVDNAVVVMQQTTDGANNQFDKGYGYFGGTATVNGVSSYGSKADVFVGLAEDNKLAAWNDSLTAYSQGVIYFNGTEVLRSAA